MSPINPVIIVLFLVAFVVLLTLKLAEVIAISWELVTVPLWGPPWVLGCIIIVCAVVDLLTGLVRRKPTKCCKTKDDE